VHRLQSVARVRQRAAGDGGQRVLQIALFERLAQRDLFDAAGGWRNQLFAHDKELMRARGMNKR